MHHVATGFAVASLGIVLVGVGLVHGVTARRPGRAVTGVEDIYVVRSLRVSRVAPTPYCSETRTGFGTPTFEDRYTFHTIVVGTSNSKMTDANARTIGHLRACFGGTSVPLAANFFAEGDLDGVSFTGRGDCRATRADLPERGITAYRCFLDLGGLPDGYAGGLLTTNTVVSRRPIGGISDPPGYVQPSIATVRLWKTRKQP